LIRPAIIALAMARWRSEPEPSAHAWHPAMGTGMSDTSDRWTGATVTGAAGIHQILPCQYFDRSGGHRMVGEQRLMLAMLADAINVFQQGVLARSTRKRLLYVDAERWIMAERASLNAFSFATVCDALGIEPVVLRRRLIAWKHRMRRERECAHPAPHLRLKITPRERRMRPRRKRDPRSL
jgi:hypothetical protein